MINHYELALEHMTTAGVLRDALNEAYRARPKNPIEIAQLNDDLRQTLTMAKLHTNLAEVGALYDLRASVDQLFQALTSEPEPRPASPRPGSAQLVALPERQS